MHRNKVGNEFGGQLTLNTLLDENKLTNTPNMGGRRIDKANITSNQNGTLIKLFPFRIAKHRRDSPLVGDQHLTCFLIIFIHFFRHDSKGWGLLFYHVHSKGIQVSASVLSEHTGSQSSSGLFLEFDNKVLQKGPRKVDIYPSASEVFSNLTLLANGRAKFNVDSTKAHVLRYILLIINGVAEVQGSTPLLSSFFIFNFELIIHS